jgi:hypothetical protein
VCVPSYRSVFAVSTDPGDEAASDNDDDECDETVTAVTAANSETDSSTTAVTTVGTAITTAGADTATAGVTATAAASNPVASVDASNTDATATATDAAVPATVMEALHIDRNISSTNNSTSSDSNNNASKEQYWYALERGNGSKLVAAALDARGWKRITTTDTAPEQPAGNAIQYITLTVYSIQYSVFTIVQRYCMRQC